MDERPARAPARLHIIRPGYDVGAVADTDEPRIVRAPHLRRRDIRQAAHHDVSGGRRIPRGGEKALGVSLDNQDRGESHETAERSEARQFLANSAGERRQTARRARFMSAGIQPNTRAPSGSAGVALTVAALLEGGRRLALGTQALRGDRHTLSHDQLRTLLVRAEADLRSLGIGRNTRVMTALPDGPLTACVLLALTRSAVCMPVNPDLRGAEVEALIPELGADLLVTHKACGTEARGIAAELGLPILCVDWSGDGDALAWMGPGLAPAIDQKVPADPDQPALILLTSGSSARPKRVPLTHRHLTLAAGRMARSIALTREDCCLNFMPMFHVGAVVDLLLAPLSVGGSVVRPEAMSVPAFFDAVGKWKATWFQGVPTLLHELAVHAMGSAAAAAPASSLRLVRSVSSPLPPEWLNGIVAALGAPVIEIYGMTETAGIITSNPLPPGRAKPGSVGRRTELEVVVRDGAGSGLGPGERGEIFVRGDGVMTGYENARPEASGLTGDGWLRTGDEGYFDAGGYLFITGRIGDQINRGGEKIAPREIDEVLASHPALQEAAAFGVAHPLLGQEVAAAVVLKAGAEVTGAELVAHVSARLAHFKVPKSFHVVPELPRGPGGKLRRRLLRGLARGCPALPEAAGLEGGEPRTEMERFVAAWWSRELRVEAVRRDSDFFALGGDSLGAAGFTVGIEQALGLKVRPAALFDHSTLAAFAAYLERETKSRAPGTAPARDGLDGDILRRLLAAMSVWPGERRSEYSLFAGLRTEGAGLPIFWCGQGRGEFLSLANAAPADHPVYGTRSLYLFEGKTGKDEEALAALLAGEIEALREGREAVLGGFCAGGRIMFEAARQLQARGVPVRLLFAQEAWPKKPVGVPVALSFTKSYELSPFRKFNRPGMALAKRLSAGFQMWELDVPHSGVYAPEALREELRRVHALWSDPARLTPPPEMEDVPGTACRARISCRLHTRLLGRGWRGLARVTVTNLSQHVWQPAQQSGLHLGQRWLGKDHLPCGDPGPSTPLPRAVPPGGKVTFHLPFTAPRQGGTATLEIDMVDEGVRWFSEKKSDNPSVPLRLPVTVFDRSLFGLATSRSG